MNPVNLHLAQSRRAVYAEYQRTGKPAIKIWFAYNPEDVERVKTLPGRRYYNTPPASGQPRSG